MDMPVSPAEVGRLLYRTNATIHQGIGSWNRGLQRRLQPSLCVFGLLPIFFVESIEFRGMLAGSYFRVNKAMVGYRLATLVAPV